MATLLKMEPTSYKAMVWLTRYPCILIGLSGLLTVYPIQALENVRVCKAATYSTNYGDVLVVSKELKGLIESYRKGWKTLCSKQSKPTLSLSDLLLMAKDIEKDFKPVLDLEYAKSLKIKDENERWKSVETVHNLISETYPSFIPAFEGSHIEWEYFRPSLRKFREQVELGNREDKLFFEQFPIYDWDPWIEFTWDYGGCIRYGEFNWISHLETIRKLRQKLNSKVYLNVISRFEESMFNTLTDQFDVCTCEHKDAVMRDLLNVRDYLADMPGFLSVTNKLNNKIYAIKSQQIKVNSESEKHCSGG